MFRTNVLNTMIRITRIHLNFGIACSEKVASYSLCTVHLLLKLCHRKYVNERHENSGLPHVDWENWSYSVMKVIYTMLVEYTNIPTCTHSSYTMV